MKNQLTVIIPCKNEEKYIYKTLESISLQINSKGIKIIVADANSTDTTIEEISLAIRDFKLNLEIIQGGSVSIARNNGAKLATTPYIVFIDADAVLLDNRIFTSSLSLAKDLNFKLITCKSKSTSNSIRSKMIFMTFNFIQQYFIKSPFSTGIYFFTSKDEFFSLGGFDTTVTQSEDYLLSRKYRVEDFFILKMRVGQDDRRFKKMGYIAFLKLVLKNYMNRNNIEHFKEPTNYWV